MRRTLKSTNRPDTQTRLPQADRSSSSRAGYHAALFYDNESSLARIVGQFLDEGFEQGSPAIVVATADQRAAIVRELTDRSRDVVALQRSHDLVLLDAEETLSTFMVNGQPDARKFSDHLCRVLESVCCGRTHRTVRVFGQMVDVLWQRGERDAAIRLELLWNQLARTAAFSLLCGYAIGNFYKGVGFEEVCGQHSHIISADGKANRAAAVASETNQRHSNVLREDDERLTLSSDPLSSQ